MQASRLGIPAQQKLSQQYLPPTRKFLSFFYPCKTQTLSEFELNYPKQTRKKDKFRDKKRIKRIIFLETREVAKIQTFS